jgi:hypothetical protein
MPFSRMLAAAILLCASALAQNVKPVTGSNEAIPPANAQRTPATAESQLTEAVRSLENARDRYNFDNMIVHLDDSGAIPGGAMMDTTCYTMRSYLVARDDKNSDSTHPVGYSTCQRASQYRLKSAQLGSNSPSR